MLVFHIITIFPESFASYLQTSILKRAQKSKLIKVNLVNLRDFSVDKHRTVDDKPYGGGPGMVLKVEPIYRAVQKIKRRAKKRVRVILFSTRGKKFDQKTAIRLSKYKHLILICGRYEGVDERVAKYVADEEISIGDFILAGGELPALVLIDAVSRHVKGVVGRRESLEEIKGSYPVYTKPENFRGWRVPKILLSGNHQKIQEWRSLHRGNI
jgi:tRNA (guanine37-N1)-methyltransferase